MEALIAFAATLVSLRLSADLVRRHRERPAPGLLAWAAALAAFAAGSGAIAWGAAAGWSNPAFRVYYLCGGLLAAALLGAGSLLRTGARWVAPLTMVYVGLAVGIVLAVPLTTPVSGNSIPEAQAHLDLYPARLLAIAANSVGTLAAVSVAAAGLRRRPLGNALHPGGRDGRGRGQRARRPRRGGVVALHDRRGRRCSTPASSLLLAAHRSLCGTLAAGPPAPLPEPDRTEQRDQGDPDRELREQARRPPVREHRHPRESSHSPPTV